MRNNSQVSGNTMRQTSRLNKPTNLQKLTTFVTSEEFVLSVKTIFVMAGWVPLCILFSYLTGIPFM